MIISHNKRKSLKYQPKTFKLNFLIILIRLTNQYFVIVMDKHIKLKNLQILLGEYNINIFIKF